MLGIFLPQNKSYTKMIAPFKKSIIIRCYISILAVVALSGFPSLCEAQIVAIKNNALMDLLLIPNLGVEVKTGAHTTLSIEGTYTPFTYSGNRKWKNWLIQPEFRYWIHTPFSGEFIAINAMIGDYNLSRVPLFHLDSKRAEGKLYGGGVTLGKHFILSPHWGIETSLSLGYVHLSYKRFQCVKCGVKEKSGRINYVGPTRAAVSLVYMIN